MIYNTFHNNNNNVTHTNHSDTKKPRNPAYYSSPAPIKEQKHNSYNTILKYTSGKNTNPSALCGIVGF